jgi:hypothetical protein
MSDPGTQLRAYLDQTVERVDVEDVMARARMRKPRAPHPFVHWRSAWTAVAAALIMLISIGAVAAGAWLLRGEGIGEFVARPDGAGGPPTWSGVLILGLAIGGGALALVVGGNALSNLIYRMRDRRNTMQTIESPELELARLREENTRLNSTKRSLIAALVVVLIAVAGVAAWLIIDNAGTATEREITALIEDYYTAWQNHDLDAILSMQTEDATGMSATGALITRESLPTYVNDRSWNPQLIGDIIIIERPATASGALDGTDSPAWLVASPTFAPDYLGWGDVYEIENLSIVRQDGKLLIQNHTSWWDR